MTKVELELRVEELEKELNETKEQVSILSDAKVQNKKYVEDIFLKNKENKKLNELVAEKTKNLSELGSKYNELATLFDEYVKTFEENVKINELFLSNIKRARELMNIKITAFNGREGEKE